MEGTIVHFRGSYKTNRGSNHIIIQISGIASREAAAKLVGKKVVWKSPANREIQGKIAAAHGNKGALRVLFERGMPGQSLGKKVTIQA
ncbi:50S ribosomal protein L35ae [Candidatus Woesearchaeota archaeon]|nr:50S ribosomal protein L35ae [Candidatus Woesearchaeota archaeon]